LPHSSEQAIILPESSLVRPKLHDAQTAVTFPSESDQTPSAPPQTNPASSGPAQITPSALKVAHISHSGSVDEVRQLAITFSKPMVAVGQIEPVEAAKYITLSPQPPGR
jgi:hypothetical protein